MNRFCRNSLGMWECSNFRPRASFTLVEQLLAKMISIFFKKEPVNAKKNARSKLPPAHSTIFISVNNEWKKSRFVANTCLWLCESGLNISLRSVVTFYFLSGSSLAHNLQSVESRFFSNGIFVIENLFVERKIFID